MAAEKDAVGTGSSVADGGSSAVRDESSSEPVRAAVAVPGSADGHLDDLLSGALGRFRGLIGEVFDALEVVAAELVDRRRAVREAGKVFAAPDLADLKPVIIERLAALPAADGVGILAAPTLLPDRQRFLEWWQRGGEGYVPMGLNFDPTSVDVYDYLDMEWFVAARDRSSRCVYGPYVDFSGADRYVCTLTVPIIDDTFLGVAGTDLRMSELEPRLLKLLRGLGHDAVVLTAERRVVATNSSRWVVGSRLAHVPRAGDGEFVTVADIGMDSGWLLALADRA